MSRLLFGGLLAAARWSYLHILPHHGLQQEPPQRQPSHAVDITARIGRRQVLCGCYITRAVTRLAVLDIVPTWHVLGNVTRALAAAFYYWFFLAAGNGIPGHMIAAAPPVLVPVPDRPRGRATPAWDGLPGGAAPSPHGAAP